MKKFINIFLLGLLASSVSSVFAETIQSGEYTFNLKATRNGSEYKQGEQAEFLLTATKNGKPAEINLTGKLTKDSVDMGKNFSGSTKDGKYSVKGTLNEAGFLRCDMYLKVPSKDGKIKTVYILANAGFDVLNIKPSLPAPDDFDEYWDKQKKILVSIPMNIQLKKVNSGDPDVEAFDVQADSFNGKMSAFMAYPKNAKAKSLPALVQAHGAGVYSSTLPTRWAKLGFLVLNFNANGLPNNKPEKFYKDLAKGELKQYYLKNCNNRDTIFFRTLYMRLMRAMDVVCAQPQWDGKNLIVVGGSQGGGQALAAGGLNPKVTMVVAGYPAICDHSGVVIGRTTGWPHFVRTDASGNYDKQIVEAARYIDAVNFASRIKGKTYMLINYADNVCEPTTCYAAFNNIKAPKVLRTNEEARHAPTRGTYPALQNIMLKDLQDNGADVKLRTDLDRIY